MVIGAIFAGVVSIITTFRTNQTKKIVEEGVQQSKKNEQKIDEVHNLTNGNLSRANEEKDILQKRLSFLEKVLAEVTDKCTPGVIDAAKRKVEETQAAIGKRRKEDLISISENSPVNNSQDIFEATE